MGCRLVGMESLPQRGNESVKRGFDSSGRIEHLIARKLLQGDPVYRGAVDCVLFQEALKRRRDELVEPEMPVPFADRRADECQAAAQAAPEVFRYQGEEAQRSLVWAWPRMWPPRPEAVPCPRRSRKRRATRSACGAGR